MIEKLIEYIITWWRSYVIPAHYTTIEMLLFLTGFWLWAWAYYIIIKNIFKYKIVEMPVGVGPGNFAWEIIWSFFFVGDLGKPFQWGCRLWFFMDIFINYFTLKYGQKQVQSPFFKKYFYFLYFFFFASWIAVVYTMGAAGDDNQLGVVSALLINVVMSGLYIQQLVDNPEYRGKGFSYAVGWLKMFGTGAITVASIRYWPDNTFLITLGTLSFILDAMYIYLFKNYQPEKTHA